MASYHITMEIIKKYLSNGQYLTHEYEKTSVFLHHTCGLTAEGAWAWWNETPERVGTPFIIDRNGKIIECFNPKIWAYHLGIRGDDNYHEKHSVSIELVSGGGLYLDNGEFRFYPLYPNKLYYTVIPKKDVCELEKPWRGFKYYHKYSDEQIGALKELLLWILSEFPSIEIQNPLGDFWEYNPDVVDNHLKGVWSHSTVRPDKSDIFPYLPLIAMLEEVPQAVSPISEDSGSEEELLDPVIPSKPPKPSKNSRPKSQV